MQPASNNTYPNKSEIDAKKSSPISIAKYEEDKSRDCGLTEGHQQKFKFLTDGTLLKLVEQSEYQFYNEAFFAQPTSKYYHQNQLIQKFMPKFTEVVDIEGFKYMRLSDSTYGMTNPSSLDIKIGRSSVAPTYKKERAEKSKIKEDKTTIGSHGFRISGLLVKDNEGKTALKLQSCHSIQYPETIKYMKMLFTCNGTQILDSDACKYYLQQLEEMLYFFENVNSRYYIHASLYFALSWKEKKRSVVLIDFANVGPVELMGKIRDENFIWGLKNVMGAFKEISNSA
jgi:hypothetical protein